MNKIVELVINFEDLELEDLGVEIMSLVDKPAIDVNWLAFSKQQFVVNPGPTETKDEFISRCIGTEISNGMDKDQAAAVCYSKWESRFEIEDKYDVFGEFFEKHQDLFTVNKNSGLEDGTSHKDMMEKLESKGVNVGYPFGYCYPVSQFMFYMLGGYEGEWDLKCIKKMSYQLDGEEFMTTHWFVQHKEDERIIDLTARQFDGLLDLRDWYAKGTRANLGFPYYNVGDKKVEFDDTVPSLQVLKVYDKFREEVEQLPGLEKYYVASKYEELRKEFTAQDFAAVGHYTEDDGEIFLTSFLKLAKSEEWGARLNENTIYIDGTKEQFETVGEVAQGIRALEIINDLTERPETFYRYRGNTGGNSRNFCRAMVALDKIYSQEDLLAMSRLALQPGMGPNGANTYNIFEYKGGVNCKHYWEELDVFERNGRRVIIGKGPAPGNPGEIAGPSNNYWRFSSDEKQIVTGPAMIPNQLILRQDELGNYFHVYFSKETINKIAKKFLADNNTHNTDINHDNKVITNNTLLESWIVSNPEMDKAKGLGFSVPEGTWMVSYKINEKQTWDKIKSGELNGFSVTGNFIEKLQNG